MALFHVVALLLFSCCPSKLVMGVEDAVHDLNAENFNSSLWAAPAKWAMVEFFANWCPACRNYKPQYERVARVFNGKNAAHPGIVYMARIDCALQINSKICEEFKILHYPTLLWGTPSKFGWEKFGPDSRKGVEEVGNGRTAERLIQWINHKIGKSFTLEDSMPSEGRVENGGSFDPVKVALSIYDIEEATAEAMGIISSQKLLKGATRSAFIEFLQLLVVKHPSKRCRKGAAELLLNLEELWPSLQLHSEREITVHSKGPALSLEKIQICGNGVPRGYWIFCRGSRNETRGYSCGLWLLFHALSVRVEDGLAPASFQAICNFVTNFFTCSECREHFSKFCSSSKANISTRSDLVLWLWRAHNEVNKRVGKEERALGGGDPEYPKSLWPSKHLCEHCWLAEKGVVVGGETGVPSFNESEVLSFLTNYYGQIYASNESLLLRVSEVGRKEDDGALLSLDASSLSAMVVPMGAALAIAVASLGFGGLACLWRMQQKRKKQMRRQI